MIRTLTGALGALFVTIAMAAPVTAADLKPAPDFSMPDHATAKTIKLSDFKGKVVILDFWATWCPPCREEIPGFISLQKKYGDEGLQVVGVALDQQGAKVVTPFVKEYKINYPIGIGTSAITALYGGVRGIPTTFVIDREGRIVTKHVGFASEEQFEKDIKPLL